MDQSPQQGQKTSLESLTREELVNKYKSLLSIAKKAKQAKDEISEENRKLKDQLLQHETQKDADKKSLVTMKEMLEAYTEHKLDLITQLSEVQKQKKLDMGSIDTLSTENESLKRQLSRLRDDNESLLSKIDNMEKQLQQLSLDDHETHRQIQEASNANEKMLCDNNDLSKSLNVLNEKYQLLKDVNNEQRQKFNSLKDRFIDVHRKLKKLKECKKILLETQHEYADSVSQWQMEIIKASKLLCKELNDLRVENARLLKKLEQQSDSNKNSSMHQICMEKLKDMLAISERSKLEFMQLKQENLNFKHTITEKYHPWQSVVSSEKLNELYLLSKTALLNYKELQDKCTSLDSQTTNDYKSYFISKLEVLSDLANKVYIDYSRQSEELAALRLNTHLLPDCKEQNVKQQEILNEEYYDSGSMIDETKSLNAKQRDELNDLKEQHILIQQSAEKYQALYAEKEKEHVELLDEMRELNEALKVRGDCISRLQEDLKSLKTELQSNSEQLKTSEQLLHEREQEIESNHHKINAAIATIEESNRKMESLEKTNLLNEEKARVLAIELELLKSSQSHLENDSQSELLSTSTISKADEIQRLKDVEDTFEDKYIKLRALAAKLKKKLQDEISQKQDSEKKLIDLRAREKEISADLQLKCNEMDLLKAQLTEKQKHIENLKGENIKLKSSRKQANVLNLEIEAAEKSLTEVTNKLAARTSELDASREHLQTKESTITQLRKEIELLESSKSAETKHSQELKDQINHLQNTLKDAVHSKQQSFDRAKILEQDIENLKIDIKTLKMEMATAKGNLESTLISVKSENEQISNELAETQASLNEYKHKLKHAERASEDLKIEYLDYKVKAQAVLRKNQTRDTSKERELGEELLTLRKAETESKVAMDTLSCKLEALEKEKDDMVKENTSLTIRSKELMQLIEEMRLQSDALNNELQKTVQQQHETLKQHRQQIESMDICQKEQLQSVNINYQRQLELLRQELTNNIRLTPTVGAAKSLTNTSESSILSDQTKLEFLLMEREDAEGSEEATETIATLAASRKISNDSTLNSRRFQHDFMPLDELLNTPINALSCETLITSPVQLPDDVKNTDILQMELNATKDRLQKLESQVRHLTTLLAENEQDLAKLTQMNDMLKEELRRQERSVEREQHMHNSEYIKNVILKFLTLNNTDEKTRLVPVLNTILKLSRSETEILNCVAKGQKVSDSLQQRAGGWSQFLPWGGSSGSNNN